MIRRPRASRPDRILAAVAEDARLSAVHWLLADADGRIMARGRLEDGGRDSLPGALDRTVLIVPGQDVALRSLTLGPVRPGQARAAALQQMADALGRSPGDLQIAMSAPDEDGARLTGAVSATTLTGWTDRASQLGLAPDVILPDCLTPPVPADSDWVALNLFDRVAVRGRRTAFTAEPELAAMVMAGASAWTMDDDSLIAQAMADAAVSPPLNLLDGRSHEGGQGWRPWRRVMVLAALLAMWPLIDLGAQAVRYELGAAELQRRSEAQVRGAWPDTPDTADPAQEARRRLGPLLTGGFSNLSAALFTAIESIDGARLDSLVLDDAGQVRAAISHGDYADLERLNSALADQGLVLDAESVLEEDGRMVSDVLVMSR